MVELQRIIVENEGKRSLFDASQVRRRLHISPPTLRKYVRQGKLRPIPRTGPKDRLLFRRNIVEEFAKIRPDGGFTRGPKPKEEIGTQFL